MKNVLKKGIAFTLALTLSVSSANVSLFITKADQQAEEKSNVENSNFTVNSETVKPKVVEEVMSDRTTDSTTFGLTDRKSTRLNSSHVKRSRMPSSA